MNENKSPELVRWTNASTYCFERDCKCEGCIYKENLETKCEMKNTVLNLFSKFGKPEDKYERLKKKQLFITTHYGLEAQKLRLIKKTKDLRLEILRGDLSELFNIYADVLNILGGIILYDDIEAQIKEIQSTRIEREVNLVHQKNFKLRKEGL